MTASAPAVSMAANRTQPLRAITWVSIAVAVPYVLVLGGTITIAGVVPEGRFLMQLLTVGTAVAGLFVAYRAPAILRSPVVVAGTIFIGATLASALTSQRPAASLEAVALLILTAPCYLAIRAAAWDGYLGSRIRWLVVVSAFLVLIPYVVQVIGAWGAWWSVFGLGLPPIRPGNAAGTVGHPNALATYTYLLVPYAVWSCWSWGRGRLVAALLAGAALFALITTGSRGAWLGAIVGLAVGGLLLPIDRSSARRRLSAKAIALGAGVSIFAVAVIGPWILVRFAAGDASRLELWTAASSIFAEFPILGGGPGSWQGLRPLEPVIDPGTVVLLTAHNSVLHFAAEGGIVGLAAAALICGAVALVAWRSHHRASEARRAEVAVVVGSLAALAVHSLVDPQFMLPAVVLMTMYLIARIDEPISSDRPDERRRYRWPLLAASAAMLFALLLLVRVDAALLHARTGMEALDRGAWPEALASLDRAVELHDLGIYELGRAIALSRLDRPSEAADAVDAQATTDPIAAAYAGSAVLREEADPVRAAEAAGAVRLAGAYDPTATLNAAAVLDGRSNPAAVEMIAGVLVRVPFLRLDPLPRGPVSAGTWRAAIDQAIEQLATSDPLAAANIAFEAGDRQRAADLARSSPEGPERTVFEAYAAARAGTRIDLEVAREAVKSARTRRGAVWFARSALLTGSAQDQAWATRLGMVLTGTDPLMTSAVDLSDDWRDANVAQVQGYPRSFSNRLGPRRPYAAGMATLATERWRP